MNLKRFPWFTCLLGLAVVCIWIHKPLAGLLEFRSPAVHAGEAWRVFSCHLTHYTRSHMVWDLVAFLAFAGVAEWRHRTTAWTLGLVGGAAIALTVGWLQPEYTSYRGLSGLTCLWYGFLAAQLLVDAARRDRKLGVLLGGGAWLAAAIKAAWEWRAQTTLFVAADALFLPVPLAHFTGLVLGASWAVIPALGRAWVRSRKAVGGVENQIDLL